MNILNARVYYTHRDKPSRLSVEDARLRKTIKKAAELHALAAGWYFGGGAAISGDAIECAINLLKLAAENGLWRSNVFPRVEGGVQVSLYEGKHEVEIAIEPNTKCAISYEFEGDLAFDSDEVSFSVAVAKLRDIARKICTSEQFTPSISTTNEGSSTPSRASPQQMVVYLSSAANALKVSQVQSVRIYGASTKKSPQTQRFFGASTPATYPLIQSVSSKLVRETLIPAI